MLSEYPDSNSRLINKTTRDIHSYKDTCNNARFSPECHKIDFSAPRQKQRLFLD